MAFNDERGSISIRGERGGSANELIAYLQHMQSAYNRIYLFENFVLDSYFDPKSRRYRRHFSLGREGWLSSVDLITIYLPDELIRPEDQLDIPHIRINSPGVWEFLGSLNPLQQIREYLNDRHRRRQDREYREKSERDKLILENEILRWQIFERQNSAWQERIRLLKEIGLSNDEIQSLVWVNMGLPLSALGTHQDSGLISIVD